MTSNLKISCSRRKNSGKLLFATSVWPLTQNKKSIFSSDVALLALSPLKSSTSEIWALKVTLSAMFSQLELSSIICCSDVPSLRVKSIMKFWHKIELVSSLSTRKSIINCSLAPWIYLQRCWKKIILKESVLTKLWIILSLLERWKSNCLKNRTN